MILYRKRSYENRRVGALYARKDPVSYGTSGKRNPPSSGSKSSTKKDNEKYDDGATVSSNRGELGDVKVW